MFSTEYVMFLSLKLMLLNLPIIKHK